MGFLVRLRELACQRPSHAAVCDARGEWDYAELAQRVEAACSQLCGQGIGPGSVVGITLDDEVEHLVATLALLARGARQIVLATHDPLPRASCLPRGWASRTCWRALASPMLEGVAQVDWPCSRRADRRHGRRVADRACGGHVGAANFRHDRWHEPRRLRRGPDRRPGRAACRLPRRAPAARGLDRAQQLQATPAVLRLGGRQQCLPPGQRRTGCFCTRPRCDLPGHLAHARGRPGRVARRVPACRAQAAQPAARRFRSMCVARCWNGPHGTCTCVMRPPNAARSRWPCRTITMTTKAQGGRCRVSTCRWSVPMAVCCPAARPARSACARRAWPPATWTTRRSPR